MDKKYKVLKKFGDFKKGEIFDPTDGYEGTEEEIAVAVEEGFIAVIEDKESGDVSQVTFQVRSRDVKGGIAHRVFNVEKHGEKFKELVDEFAESNKDLIVHRKDE
jgi:hypothetical protein